MKVGLPALLLLLATGAGAQSFVSMGRLFTTPGERVRLDTLRDQASQAAIAAAGMARGAGGAGGMPGPGGHGGPVAAGGLGGTDGLGAGGMATGAGGVPSAPGMALSAGCPPGSAPGCPPAAADGVIGGAAGAGGKGAGGAAATGTEAQEAPGLRLGGIIRRSHGPAMVIVNGEVQPAPQGGLSRGTVRLQADGRSVVLKPGQRYDPATGEVHEAAR